MIGMVWRPQAWRVRAFIAGACLALLAAAASVMPFVWSWEEGVDLYVLFRARGVRPAPNDVVIVPIDGRTARNLFLPASADEFERCADVRLEALPAYRNPDPPEILSRWPRCLHARALDALAVGQPEAVVMDISFRPRNDPAGMFAEQDRSLAAAMRRLGKVVLVRKIRSEDSYHDRAQPLASEIEAAASAVAPFLLLGDRLERADKYCTFMEDSGWSGPCLPAVAHQIASIGTYPELHQLLGGAQSKNFDLLPPRAEALLAHGALEVPVTLIRHLAMTDPLIGERMRALVTSGKSALSTTPLARLRSLAGIYLGQGIRYFNFYGPPGAFGSLRYEALAAGDEAKRPAPGSLRGKVVFIGFAEYERPEPIEHFATPFTTAESVKLSGVELAATAFANLHDGSAIEPAPGWTRALITLSVGLLCTLLCVALPAIVAVALCAAGMLAYFAGAVLVFEQHALWLPIVMPLGVTAPLTMGAGLAMRYTQLRRERDHSAGVISELLSPRLKQKIVSKRLRLADLQVTGPGACLNTDIAGYTKYAEGKDPDEVRRTINEYFDVLDTVLEQHGVESSDFAGDGMMAVWSDKTEDASLRARVCDAALEVASAAERFRLARCDAAFATRVGVDYGHLQIGMIGGSSHKGYRPIGDVPNTASRLQGLNETLGTRVLVSEEVIKGLLDRFVVRDLGHFVLRGKKNPTHVYELIGKKDKVAPD